MQGTARYNTLQLKTSPNSMPGGSTSHHSPVNPMLGLPDPVGLGGLAPIPSLTSTKGVTCPVCGKFFNNSSALAKHKLTHSDERKYVCKLCNKAFKRQDHLNGHTMTHRSKKPFECSISGCGKSYCDSRSLRRHLENQHRQDLKKCINGMRAEDSGANSPSNTSMSAFDHIDGVKPVKCTLCEKRFKNVAALNGHMRLHGGYFKKVATSSDGMQPVVMNTSLPAPLPRRPSPSVPSTVAPPIRSQQRQPILGEPVDNIQNLLIQADHIKQEPHMTVDYHHRDQRSTCFSSPYLSPPAPNTLRVQACYTNSTTALSGHLHQEYCEPSLFTRRRDSLQNQLTLQRPLTPTYNYQPHNLNIPPQVQQSSQSLPPTPHHPLTPSADNTHATIGMTPTLVSTPHLQHQHTTPCENYRFQFPPSNSMEPTPFHTPSSLPPSLQQHRSLAPPITPDTPLDTYATPNSVTSTDHFTYNNVATPPSYNDSAPSASSSSATTVTDDVIAPLQQLIIDTDHLQHTDSLNDRLMPEDVADDDDCFHPAACTSKQERLRAIVSDLFRPIDQSHISKFDAHRKRHASADPDNFVQPKRIYLSPLLPDNFDKLLNDCTPNLNIMNSLANRHDAVPQCDGIVAQTDSDSTTNTDHSTDIHCEMHSTINDAESMEAKDHFQMPYQYNCQTSNVNLDQQPTVMRPRSRTSEFVRPAPAAITSDARRVTNQPPQSPPPNDDVFCKPDPNIIKAPRIRKRKPRPEPLVIPAHTSFGFASRLRSPRLWSDPSSSSSSSSSSATAAAAAAAAAAIAASSFSSRLSPPAYTPPPMLSPIRSGPGLFWSMPNYPLTPMTAPARRMSLNSRFEAFMSDQVIDSQTACIASDLGQADIEEEVTTTDHEVPETDILPHVNIGEQYQSVIPDFIGGKPSIIESPKEVLLYSPSFVSQLSDEQVQQYLDFACSAAIPGGGTNKELALHILFKNHGDIENSILQLMDPSRMLQVHSTFYDYLEVVCWTKEEIEKYQEAMLKHSKDFYVIAEELKYTNKRVKDCIEFYYLWKKVCADEYKHYRIIRRRADQSLRSKPSVQIEPTSIPPDSDIDNNNSTCCNVCSMTFLNKHELEIHHDSLHPSSDIFPTIKAMNGNYESNKDNLIEVDNFPCKHCNRVFYKVKSRNAHMKSHRSDP